MADTVQSTSPLPTRNGRANEQSVFDQARDDFDTIAEAIQLVECEHDKVVAKSGGKLWVDCPLRSELKKIGSANSRFLKRLTTPTFRVGLIGEFSIGKSTLINALLGQEVLETRVIQGTTTFPIRIRYADRLGAELYLRDGSRVQLSDKTGGGILKQLKSCAKDDDVENRLSHASLYLPSPFLKDGIEIIDAPGIDSISESDLRLTLEAMQRFCDSFVILEPPPAIKVSQSDRNLFGDVGKELPKLWDSLDVEVHKASLRTLVSGVNLDRGDDGIVTVRIVWRGGLVTEVQQQVPIHSHRYCELEKHVVDRLRELNETGATTNEIISTRNDEGFTPCRGGKFTAAIIMKLKQRYDITSKFESLRQGEHPANKYTAEEIAVENGVQREWIYRKISRQKIRIKKDSIYGCYLFPRTKKAIRELQRLKEGKCAHVSF